MIEEKMKIWSGNFIAALFFAFALVWSNNTFAQDNENRAYCNVLGRIVIFAVDVTTPYDQTDKDAIISMTDKLLSSIQGGEKLVIRTIADSHARSERLIERCIPYCPASGVIGRLFKCSDGMIRTDLDKVRIDVISALKTRLSKFDELKFSDIVRTIAAISSEEFREGHKLSLFIYSDLIERSDYFTPQYMFSYSLDKLMYGIGYYKLFATLKGSDVHVAGVGRYDSKDRRPLTIKELNKLKEFWNAYFKKSGADSVTITQNAL